MLCRLAPKNSTHRRKSTVHLMTPTLVAST